MKIEPKLLKKILDNLNSLRNGGVNAVTNNCDTEENSQSFLGAFTGCADELMAPFNERVKCDQSLQYSFATGEASEEVYEEWLKHMIGCFALLGISEAIYLAEHNIDIGSVDNVIDKRPGWSKERAEFWLEQNQKKIHARLTTAFKTIVEEMLEEQKR